MLFTISRALTVGRKAAPFTVAGNELGLCAQIAAVAFGVGAVVERSAAVFTIVKWAGAVYLGYLGSRPCGIGVRSPKRWPRITPVRPLRAMRAGFLAGMLPPLPPDGQQRPSGPFVTPRS